MSQYTELLHTSFEVPDAHRALTFPVYENVAFEFPTAEQMADAFSGRSGGHAYTRLSNPTVANFERRIRTATKAASVTAFGSGMGAITSVLLTLAREGGNIVTSRHLFGNSLSLLQRTLGGLGLEIRLVDLTNPDETAAHVDDRTLCIYLEAITNPQLEVADLPALSALAHGVGAPLVVDTTVVPFTAFKAKKLGVDIEVFSSTKYLSGGGTSLGGVAIDYGTAPWRKSYALADRAARYGAFAFTQRLKAETLGNVGTLMSPHTAYLHALGLETLPLRFERQASTCLALAEGLQTVPGILAVNYPGLPDNPFHDIATRQFGALPGAVLTFDLANRADCFSFLNHLRLIRRATNLFENKTLALHPASTIFASFSASELEEMQVSERTIRLSVGLEDAADLLADIRQALPEV